MALRRRLRRDGDRRDRILLEVDRRRGGRQRLHVNQRGRPLDQRGLRAEHEESLVREEELPRAK